MSFYRPKTNRVQAEQFTGFNDRDLALFAGAAGYDVRWYDEDGKPCSYLKARESNTELMLYFADVEPIELKATEVLYRYAGGPWQTMSAEEFGEQWEPDEPGLDRPPRLTNAYTSVRACRPEDMLIPPPPAA